MFDVKQTVEEYLDKSDWRVTENSNAHFNLGSLNRYLTGKISANYWLSHVYPEQIRIFHDRGFFHIHDLGGLTLYCCGYSLRDVIEKGVVGVSNIPKSKPAKHFMSLLNQIANLTTIFQNEIMGAVAFSSFDTLCAPFVKIDGLTYDEVYQNMQNFIFSMNSNSRGGAEPAFSNLTFDLTPPKDLIGQPVWYNGTVLQGMTYRDCQKEMDMINRAFYEIMLEGDAEGAPFAYPIPTYNIHDRFDWDNPNNEKLWEMAGKYGIPYFANFINSDMDPSDARSMCCRLRIDKRELRKRGGGLFGSGEKTGSIGVVTINLPVIAYLAEHEEQFFRCLDVVMDTAKQSLEYKRTFLQRLLDIGLLPAFAEYVGTLKNHFSTIGLVGMNEMCQNLMGVGIETAEGHEFSCEVLDFMRKRIADYQEETGNLYNLEATPAESTCYRLARIDKKLYQDIYTQGTGAAPYYTNSCHLPVNQVYGIETMIAHQEQLQSKFTGGTVNHLYLAGSISGDKAKRIVRAICENYETPYISLSPVYSICPNHNFISGKHFVCPYCGEDTQVYQRVTGYIRQVDKFNDGKKAEFKDRVQVGGGA